MIRTLLEHYKDVIRTLLAELDVRTPSSQFAKKSAPRMKGQTKIFHVPLGAHQFRESLPGVAPRIVAFCIVQVVGCHSENGISFSENGISNSESCSENTPEVSESSENGLFTPRAFFPEIGVVPRLLIFFRNTDRKGHFCRDTGRVSQGRPAIQGVFRNFM